MSNRLDPRPLLLVVDDESTNLQLMRKLLDEDYRLLFAKDGPRALDLARDEGPDLILLDVMMPDMSGHEACKRLKADPATASIPIIFVTALTDAIDEVTGFEAGAVDYINKPVSAPILRARVRTHLSLVHLDELRESRLEIVQRLGRAAEYKDTETGYHVVRMSHYAAILARAIGQPEGWVEDLLAAAPMHDIGKIGVPDHILTKPGKLTPEEWEVMKTHPSIGAAIIGDHSDSMLRMAYQAALTHHEKWDGSGYPRGLAGDAIPLEGRLVAVADVFDALTSVRPYKRPWSNEESADLIKSEAGRHFDPAVVEAFLRCLPDLLAVQQRYTD
ncbi:MAG TPA: HD domain-containing phosphohydrolase [Magnetospirillaceae bacterium]|nr:HD domain-containing phosphohydrolase [Magnetospirillaceae bacterium]